MYMKHLPIVIAVLGLIPRCIHLTNTNYYILGLDSYLFHYLAQHPHDPMITNDGYPLHIGITYLIYLCAHIIGITAASCTIPIVIYLITYMLLYWFTKRYFGPIVALATVAIWSLTPQAVLITSSGYLDRDGISVFLILMALILMIVSIHKTWLCMIIGLIGVIGISICQWVQWHLVGALLTSSIAILVIGCRIIQPQMTKLLLLSIIVLVYGATYVAIDIMGVNTDAVGEMQPVRLADIFLYFSWAVPLIVIGVVIVYKKPDFVSSIVVIWVVSVLASAGVVSRVLVFTLPAVCILAGITVGYSLQRYRDIGGYQTLSNRWGVGAMGIIAAVLVITSVVTTNTLQTNHRMSPNTDWVAALEYLAHETPNDALIGCMANHSYWVLDIGERIPVNRGDHRGYTDSICELYCATNIEQFYNIMSDMGCDYVIASTWEYEAEYPIQRLMTVSGIHSKKGESILYNSLYSTELLPTVYRNDTVIIIPYLAVPSQKIT